MKKLFLSFVLSLGVTMSLMATDVLYLKNGSVIKGEVLEFNVGGKVRMQTLSGNMFIYDADLVERIEKESDNIQGTSVSTDGQNEYNGESKSGDNLENDVNRRFRVKGYRGFVELVDFYGGGVHYPSYGALMFMSHGAQVCPWFFIGAGIGLNLYVYESTYNSYSYYSYTEKRTTAEIFVPFYIDARVFPIGHKRVTPVIGTKLGYAAGSMRNDRGAEAGGFYHQYNFGVSVAFKPKLSIYAMLGYSDQRLTMDDGSSESCFRGFLLTTGVDF